MAGTEDSFRTLIPSFVCVDAMSFDVYRHITRSDFLGRDIISIEFRDLKRNIVPKIQVTCGISQGSRHDTMEEGLFVHVQPC